MSDLKEQQKAQDEQTAEDLAVPEEQAEAVRGGEISLTYKSTQVEYHPQK
jgi:hypothetical protein